MAVSRVQLVGGHSVDLDGNPLGKLTLKLSEPAAVLGQSCQVVTTTVDESLTARCGTDGTASETPGK